MIRVDFKEPDTAIWKRWTRECATAAGVLETAYKEGRPIEVTDLYRRKSIKDSVYFAKDGPFRGRCAYCDSYIADFQHGDIEHFRPKKAVTDENDVPVQVAGPDGKPRAHPGYFWRAYDWRNLLPSCITCNQPGDNNIGKRNRFPLKNGKYAVTEADIAGEEPLLFNPLDSRDEDPEGHIDIDLETGLLRYKNQSRRAEMCVKIFGLNIRDQLVNERKDAMDAVKARFIKLITIGDEATVQSVRRELDEMEKGSFNQTLARRAQRRTLKERFG